MSVSGKIYKQDHTIELCQVNNKQYKKKGGRAVGAPEEEEIFQSKKIISFFTPTSKKEITRRHGRLLGGHKGRPVLRVGRDVTNGQ